MWLGIDFGTTNSAISISDGTEVHTFKVDGELPNLLPSLIYVTKNYDNYTGTAARDAYLEKNTDRPSLMKPITVGTIRLDVGDSGGYKEIEQNVVVFIDVLSPGRLIRSIKTGLRTIEYVGSNIFGRYYRVEELIAVLLKHLCEVVEPILDEPITQIVMGRPVKFSDNPDVDRHAEERIVAAAKLVGIEDVVFMPEPIAAAWSYHRDFTEPTNTFIFDFGGGTLDLTIAELGGEAPRILATEGVLIGGDDFDKRLFEHLLPYFGKGAKLTVDRYGGVVTERPVPEHIWESMLDWQTLEELKMSETMGLIEEAAFPGNSTDTKGMKALHELISRNLYYKLLRQVEDAKVALSSAESTRIVFHEQSIHIDQEVTRSQFEQLVNMEYMAISRAIDKVVAESGLTVDQIQQVVPTGGSSQIPLFQRLLAEKFASAEFATRADRNMTGVVQGLGIYGYDRDVQDGEAMPLIRRRLVEYAKKAPVILPMQGGKKRDTDAFSHGVVGLDHKGDIRFVPYNSGKPTEDISALRLRSAVFSSKAGKVIFGSTHTRFVIGDLNDLNAMHYDPLLTPHPLKLARDKAEEYSYVGRWDRSENWSHMILVSRWGNVRAFPIHLMDRPLRSEGTWKLDMRDKPDPPCNIIGAKRNTWLLLVTEGSRAVRIPMSMMSSRVTRVLLLEKPEKVNAINVDGIKQVICVFANGSAERIYVNDMRRAAKGGNMGRRLFPNDAPIIGLIAVGRDKNARAITSRGRVVDLELDDVKQYSGRNPVTQLERFEELIDCWAS